MPIIQIVPIFSLATGRMIARHLRAVLSLLLVVGLMVPSFAAGGLSLGCDCRSSSANCCAGESSDSALSEDGWKENGRSPGCSHCRQADSCGVQSVDQPRGGCTECRCGCARTSQPLAAAESLDLRDFFGEASEWELTANVAPPLSASRSLAGPTRPTGVSLQSLFCVWLL